MFVFYIILISTTVISAFGYYLRINSSKVVPFGPNDIEHQKYQKSIPLFFALLSFAVMVFFISYRSNYGDTWLYVLEFQKASSDLSDIKPIIDSDSKSKGFDILQIIFKHFISKDYTIWFTFLAIISTGAIIKLYYQHSINFAMSAFLFVASGSFTWMMNGVRQFLAVCLIMYGFNYVLKRKTISFLLLVLLAATIHQTALFWIPLYFIVRLKPWSKGIWFCIIATLLIIFGIDQFTDFLDASFEGTENEGVGSALLNYGMEDGAIDDGVNFIRVLISAVPPIIAFVRKKAVDEQHDYVIDICINMSVVATGVYLVGTVTSGILVGRMPIYFMLPDYILLPWLLNKTFEGKTRTFIKIACYVLYFAYFYYSFAMQGAGFYGSEKLNLFYY